MRVISGYLSSDEVEKLDAVARDQDRTRSWLITNVLRSFIESLPPGRFGSSPLLRGSPATRPILASHSRRGGVQLEPAGALPPDAANFEEQP